MPKHVRGSAVRIGVRHVHKGRALKDRLTAAHGDLERLPGRGGALECGHRRLPIIGLCRPPDRRRMHNIRDVRRRIVWQREGLNGLAEFFVAASDDGLTSTIGDGRLQRLARGILVWLLNWGLSS